MHFLFVAPEICPPFTEGRKRFVADLTAELAVGHRVDLLTSQPTTQRDTLSPPATAPCCPHPAACLLRPLAALPSRLSGGRPDVVCQFPYGTFTGVRRFANTLFMRAVDTYCRAKGIPCVTVLYSIEGSLSPAAIARHVSCLALSQRPDWQGYRVDIGLGFDQWPPRPKRAAGPLRILFLAGMWQRRAERLDHVLEVRGLRHILQAGEELSSHGFQATAASPLFEYPELRERVLSEPSNKWPAGTLTLLGTAPVPDVYYHADLFLFPYSSPILHFVPTSVLEAMAAGTPTVLADHPFLRTLAGVGEIAFFFDPSKQGDLERAVLAAARDPERLSLVASTAQKHVTKEWSLRRSAQQLLEVASAVRRRHGASPSL